MENKIPNLYETWLNSECIDMVDRKKLKKITDDSKGIKERFYKELEFGNGSMRGVRGRATNRISI